MTDESGAHKSASDLMRTGYEQRGTIVHPMLGAWAQHYLGPSSPSLPSTVCVNNNAASGNGFFPAAYSPVPILNPDTGLANITPSVSANEYSKRVKLMQKLDADFGAKFRDEHVKSYGEFYDSTLKLMKSCDPKAFDLGGEPAELRDKYGRNELGQGLLLARRLVEHGVRFVEVGNGKWDMHGGLAESMEEHGGQFDRAFAQLIRDLDARRMLDSTLVVVCTEFGRKPKLDGNGRGHFPRCFSTVLAGGGVKRGYAHGSSDDQGREPATHPMTVGEFHATIAWSAGLPIEKKVMPPQRPLNDRGKQRQTRAGGVCVILHGQPRTEK